MKIEYDIPMLNRIIKDFSQVSGLPLLVKDTEGHNLAAYERTPVPLCKKVHQSDEGERRCKACDAALMAECRATQRAVTKICHAGLADTVVPILKEGIFCGYVFIGRMRTELPEEEISARVGSLGIAAEDAVSCYRATQVFEPEKTACVGELASLVLFSDAVKIKRSPLTDEVMKYIENHLADDLRISTLCRVLHTSKNVLYREIFAEKGMTVSDTVTECRIEAAKKMLRNTDEPLSKIGEQVGFSNSTYFSKIFRRKVGVSPTAYRKRKTTEKEPNV